MGDWRVVAAHALRESARRRVLHVVGVLSVAFLVLYGVGANEAFDATGDFSSVVDDRALTGATLLGLAMFATLFLGAVLAVFLTNDAVRGDAERGLLQPLVVRPLGREAYLLGRLVAAVAVASTYVVVLYACAVGITSLVGDGTPVSGVVGPAVRLAAAVALVATISLLGSTVFGGTANGILVFMVFGAGLTGGLLADIGDALDVETLEDVGRGVSYALPFAALYQDALRQLTADVPGIAGQLLQLGPFGGARAAGPLLWPWAVAFGAGLAGVAALAFRRADL